MKTKLLLTLSTLSLLLLFSCPTKTYTTCDTCRTETISKTKFARDRQLHPKITIQGNEQDWYQFFHVDAINGYWIVGKMIDFNNGIINKIHFDIIEEGSCKRYKIDNVEILPYPDPDSQDYTYMLVFEVNPLQNQSQDTSFTFNDSVNVGFNNPIFLKINSTNEVIVTRPPLIGPPNRGPIACPIDIIDFP